MKKWIPDIMTLFIISAMVAAAELTGEREIIFPEIAAIAVGAMLAPKFSWKTNKVRIFVCIMLCATSGMLIVAYVPGAVWMQMMVAYLLGLTIFSFSGTTFAPMISAIVLPVLLQTRSVVYLISAAGFTFLILVFRYMLEKGRIVETEPFTVVKMKRDKAFWVSFGKKVLIASVVIAVMVPAGVRFAVAPPLLVAFTEFCNPEAKPRKRPVQAVILVTLCALAGSLCRFLLTMTMGLPLTLAALCAGILAIILIKSFGLYIPPAAAMMLLAMLIPSEMVVVFPLQVGIGITVLMIAALAGFHTEKKD